jgi:hypothetical protein
MTATTTWPTCSATCPPRWATPRSLDRLTYGAEAAALARALGVTLMPHQQLVLDVGLEIDPTTGWFAYRDVCVTEPRQSGKSLTLLVLSLWRALAWQRHCGRPQSLVYSAQRGTDARRTLLEEWAPLVAASRLAPQLPRVRLAQGAELLGFRNGSALRLIPNTPSAGHGRVLDLALVDEAFADEDDRREQAVVPAMATRADAQLWVTSTAGTADALYLLRKVAHGRAAVDADRRTGSAYFEWSAADDVDVDDPATWATFMPALGHTQAHAAVAHAHDTLPPAEFARAFANRWTVTDDDVIPAPSWASCQDPNASPAGGVYLGLDVPPERSSAVLVAAALDGDRVAVELVEQHDGLAWVLDRLTDLRQTHADVRGVVLHAAGPAGTFALEIERQWGTGAHIATDADMTVAAGLFYDAVAEGRLAVYPSPALDAAVAGARQRRRGDAFTWSRRSARTDLSPLVAASLAAWRAISAEHGGLWVFR